MNRTVAAGLLSVALGVLSPARAQGKCTLEQTITQCYEQVLDANFSGKLQQEADQKAAASAQQEEREDLAKSQTGASAGRIDSGSTITDLVPLFDALGLISDSESEKGKLALNLNFLLPVQNADHNTQLRLLVNTSPKPLDALVKAFPEAARAARQDSLQKSISVIGDSQVSLTYSLMNDAFGRDYGRYAPVIEPVFAGAIASARSTDSTLRNLEFIRLLGALTQEMREAVSVKA